MTMTEEKQMSEAEALVANALHKIGGKKEKDLCRFLPSETEGYMHHFTLQKIRKTKPEEFRSLLQEFILNPETPQKLEPKTRIRRNKSLSLNQTDLKLVLQLAQKTGDNYLLSKLGAKFSLPRIKKELIKSIRENRMEEELWQSYIQSVESQSQK